MRPSIWSYLLAILLCASVNGCSVETPTPSAPEPGGALRGMVHGGQQPVTAAHVYLLAANTTGSAGPGIPASANNASVSLLNAASTGNSDALGAYVLTDGSGMFSINGDYSCSPDTQAYLYALGGDPGAGMNPAAGLMAVLGNCPSMGNFAAATPYVLVNEVSTIAAAYAMAPYATDATHVSSSGTALALEGIQNAFANAADLETLATGVALATTPEGNGMVPQAEINTLADILAACVNSNGAMTGPANPTACYTLFNNALPGGSSGTGPTDTATAAIDIAHNPAASVTALYPLVSSTAPFWPTLGVQPSNFSIELGGNGSELVLSDSVTAANFSLTVVNGAPTLTALGSTGSVASSSGLVDMQTGAQYLLAVTSGALTLLPVQTSLAAQEIGLTDSVTAKTYELAVVSGSLTLIPN